MTGRVEEQRAWIMRALPQVVGHRGAALHAPENTAAGLREAAAQGAGWVEFDVKLSRDGVPFLLHDDKLDRTTSGKGKAALVDWAALAELDAGGWFGKDYEGERLLTLEATIALLAELGLGANVEIKPCPGREAETARIVAAMLRDDWPATLPPPLISSFSTESLAAARDTAPEIARGLLAGRLAPDWQETMAELGCASLHLDHRKLDEADVSLLRARGVPLLCYTVNDGRRAFDLVRWGALAVITDTPRAIAAALREQG